MAKFCSYCGSPAADGAQFCENCGARLAPTQNAQRQAAQSMPSASPRQPAYPQQQPAYPQQQPAYPQQQPAYPQPPVKKKGGARGALIAIGVLIAALLLFLIIRGRKPSPPVETTAAPGVTESGTTQPPAEAPQTDAPQETPTEAPDAQSPGQLNTVGAPSPSDFAWAAEALNGLPAGYTTFGGSETAGQWKAEFYFNGAWELAVVTVGLDGSISAQPYAISYGDGWEDETGEPPYVFSGEFTLEGVTGTGEYGRMALDTFYTLGNGVEYGLGRFTVNSGYTADVALVRP